MGGSFSSLFRANDDEYSEDYLGLTDLGAFLCKYIFIMLDKDKRKLVSKKEYLELVNHFREQKTTEEELDNFLKRHVKEGQSTEFIDEALFRKLIIQLAMDFDRNIPDRMEYLMTLFDRDNDGYVNEIDLCQVYDGIGIQVPIEPIRTLIAKYDADGDNRLSITEFEHLGRCAMSKLFIKKSLAPEDILVAEALRRGSASLFKSNNTTRELAHTGNQQKPNSEDMFNNNHISNGAPNNNNNNPNSEFLVVGNVVLGKPVVLKDTSSSTSMFEEANAMALKNRSFLGETTTNKAFSASAGDFEENVATMGAVLNEIQVEGKD